MSRNAHPLGAIRVFETVTRVEIASAVAGRFEARSKIPDRMDGKVVIEPDRGRPPPPRRAPRTAAAAPASAGSSAVYARSKRSMSPARVGTRSVDASGDGDTPPAPPSSGSIASISPPTLTWPVAPDR